jgi:hypothetical protein
MSAAGETAGLVRLVPDQRRHHQPQAETGGAAAYGYRRCGAVGHDARREKNAACAQASEHPAYDCRKPPRSSHRKHYASMTEWRGRPPRASCALLDYRFCPKA